MKNRKGKPPGSSEEDVIVPMAMPELLERSYPLQADEWEGKAKVQETESSSSSSHNSFELA